LLRNLNDASITEENTEKPGFTIKNRSISNQSRNKSNDLNFQKKVLSFGLNTQDPATIKAGSRNEEMKHED